MEALFFADDSRTFSSIKTMKTAAFVLALLSSASAFAPVSHTRQTMRSFASSIPADDLLLEARECAATGTVSEAKLYLEQLLDIVTECDSGSQSPMCEQVDEMAEAVASLRARVDSVQRSSPNLFASIPVVAMAFMVGFVGATTIDHGDAVPYTVQEWMWAAKGGYLPNMIVHFARNGGL